MQSNGNIIKKYLELNNKCLHDAEECLKNGDYTQASEKLWGAMVTIVKAIASQRRKTIRSHEGISAFMAEIARELNDRSIGNIYLAAEGIHQNFYENAAHPDFVKKGAKTIKQFVTRMRNRFNLVDS